MNPEKDSSLYPNLLVSCAQSAVLVGERSNGGEALTVRSGGAVGSENVGLSSVQRE